MTIHELITALTAATEAVPSNTEVLLSFEPTAMKDGFDWQNVETISDVRVCSHWPLPGNSVVVEEHEIPSKVILFYDLTDNCYE